MVPIDAVRPEDRRFLASRNSSQKEAYHFPALIYSKYYSHRDELSEDERFLLDAQILNLKNDFTESIRMCKSLLNKGCSSSVMFGAHFTNATSYFLLGLASEIPPCIREMEEICKNEPLHEEDFRLIMAFLAYSTSFDIKPFLNIDINKLSPQALIAYQFLSVNTAFLSEEQTPEAAFRVYHGLCRESELLGIDPVTIMLTHFPCNAECAERQ